jgi:glutathione synthase/RimK-type ligase-like ATP-grasp enzyme
VLVTKGKLFAGHNIEKAFQKKIGIITSEPDIFNGYYPTQAEPTMVPTEPSFTPDDQILVTALRQRGNTVKPVIWGEDVPKLKDFDLLVMRSPWDYMDSDEKRNHFVQWLKQLKANDIPVENDTELMLWLIDKHYLQDFANVGIPVIPTVYAEQGHPVKLSPLLQKYQKLIIKPCISAAGRGLEFIRNKAQAKRFQPIFDGLVQEKSYMIQPFMPEIQSNGEWSLVLLNGKYSHSVHKAPKKGDIMVHAERGGSLAFKEAGDTLKQYAEQAVSKIEQAFGQRNPDKSVKQLPLYMRVDVIDTANGPLMVECEGVEPELFIRACPGSENTFCDALRDKLLKYQSFI